MQRLKRWLLWFAGFIAMLVLILVARGWYAFRDRVPGYSLNLEITPSQPRALQVGFGTTTINPDLSDPRRPVWVAGFHHNRAATALHDDLEAVACVIDDGKTRIGIVALDAIGFFHDDVVRVRQRCQNQLRLDYLMVCSTHNHTTPDLLGLWGPSTYKSGVNPAYKEQVIASAAKAVEQAAQNLAPATMRATNLAAPIQGLVTDTRKPEVYDPDIHLVVFSDPTNGTLLGSIVGWANHPETPWSGNTELTADFCGYLRRALAKGIRDGEKQLIQGVGGTHLYLNGAIGGLISTTPSVTVRDPYLQKEFTEPSHEKAQAVGHSLAALILPELTRTNSPAASQTAIGVRAQTFLVPVQNRLYLAASYLGVLDRGYTRWKQLRTEAALITLGEVSFACVPGEIYPEIVNGGIESPAGADFEIQPVETPPLRQLMPGTVKLVVGLANDELGYMVPRSQWDEVPPFTYGRTSRPYGEINSCGPETARIVHAQLAELCRGASVQK